MKKILVVDSSKVTLNLIRKMLSPIVGLGIYEASSMAEAQVFMQVHKVFVVLTNLILTDAPDMEMLNYLAKENIPTIVFSSNVQSALLQSNLYSNIIDYVIKDTNGLFYLKRLIDGLMYARDKEVLLVEDSQSMALYVKKILEKLLLRVVVAQNGKEALKILDKKRNISLVISDYNMPIMGGLEFTKVLKTDSRFTKLVLIIIISESADELKVQLYKHGADDLIIKPILPEELSIKVLNIFLNLKQIEEISEFNAIVDQHVISSATDTKGNIIAASQAFCEISGYTKEELLGKNHRILRDPSMPDSLYKELWDTVTHKKVWRGEIKNRKKDGGYYWVDAIIEPSLSKDGGIIGYKGLRYDITDKKRIEEISITDGLTNIFNRRHFNNTFPKILEDAKRDYKIVCFLLMDIDHFKQYNDNYGHQAGDNVLIKFAACLKRSLQRAGDMAFRLGGEEFGLVYKVDTKEKALLFANRVRDDIENLKITHEYSSASKYITASMGLVCGYASELGNMDALFKEADELLYEAKESGRNQVKGN
ncbi:diguanylate cyclase [Sulfurimonas sp.]|uniref:diguanylate cyclase n=1 Tax=Sulfurimonas sp. TaxID=2022749 RepID=UPI0025E2831F|nr:diguanylate cyclase [Sulfurimonas sp.]MDD5157193.1 diguanylate cyclase [Sulfurimonas sp.]